MSEFKEPIKKLENLRYYASSFHIYGIKSREQYDNKSLRSYDNEKRRIESVLKDYISFSRSVEGKKVYITLDSKNILYNPFHNLYKIKTFTKNDINLHFILIDILKDNAKLKTSEIVEIMEEDYLSFFDNYTTLDVTTVRNKLNEYEQKGLFNKDVEGKDVYYSYNREEIDINKDSINFFTMYSPLGVIGSYFEYENKSLTFKHEYIFHALDSQIIYEVLNAISNKQVLEIEAYSKKHGNEYKKEIVPLKVMISTQGGRCYALAFDIKKAKVSNFRIDRIISTKTLRKCSEYEKYLEEGKNTLKNMWGASITDRLETIAMTLQINDSEEYIIERLEKEKRNGKITRVDDSTVIYEVVCYDAIELLPWIRSFTCRIKKLESSSKRLVKMFYNDLDAMYEMYGDKL